MAHWADQQAWVDGSLGTLEWVLLLQTVLWSVLVLLVVASVLLSEWVLSRNPAADL